MSDNLEAVRRSVKSVIDSGNERYIRGRQLICDDLIDMWAFFEAREISHRDFTDLMLIVMGNINMKYSNLDEMREFGELLKTYGSDTIRAVDENWPPVDPGKWPDGYVEKYGYPPRE